MATYKSQYTGAQIDEAVGKATGLTANNGEETTEDLATLKVGDVNYKIPEGAESEPPVMEEFLAVRNLSFESKSITGDAIVSINGNVSTPKFEIIFPLTDSETTEPFVTVNGYQIELKQHIKDKLANAVVLPGGALDSQRIVSIAADGTQQDLILGDGITVADGVISASGGGSGTQLYLHTFSRTDNDAIKFSFISALPDTVASYGVEEPFSFYYIQYARSIAIQPFISNLKYVNPAAMGTTASEITRYEFIQDDPAVLEGQYNMYTYGNNTEVAFTLPTSYLFTETVTPL